jgi:hypothetical protein
MLVLEQSLGSRVVDLVILCRRGKAEQTAPTLRRQTSTTLEASALHAAGGGAAQIVINDLDLRPSPHGVLQSAALAIVPHLMGRGLLHIK